jgi:hypothetical protein
MSATATPAKRRTRTPGVVTKKELTVAQAADQWEKAKRAQEKQKPLLEEAAAVLKAHFEKTGDTEYDGRIQLVTTPSKLVLDQSKVREYLGKKLSKFQKRTAASKSLALMK